MNTYFNAVVKAAVTKAAAQGKVVQVHNAYQTGSDKEAEVLQQAVAVAAAVDPAHADAYVAQAAKRGYSVVPAVNVKYADDVSAYEALAAAKEAATQKVAGAIKALAAASKEEQKAVAKELREAQKEVRQVNKALADLLGKEEYNAVSSVA